MTKIELEKLLGRPLTSTEDANFGSYDEIAKEVSQSLLCISTECEQTDDNRIYVSREGYSTVFTDIFTDIESITVDGIGVTDYYPAFNDDRNNDFYNSIVFKRRFQTEEEVLVSALWGFESVPIDLQRLLARAYAQSVTPTKKKNTSVKSKRVEDFWITYGDLSEDEEFIKANSATIKKYSLCNIGYVLHGDTCKLHGRYRCGYCI